MKNALSWETFKIQDFLKDQYEKNHYGKCIIKERHKIE